MPVYRYAEMPPDAVLQELDHLGPLTQQLLFNRGITTKAEADRFLNPEYEEHQHDPFLLHDMEAAVTRIMAAMAANEKIVIFSDYDCDGIPGGVVLYDFFTKIGYTNFTNYIPHRHYEGFGLSTAAIDGLAAEGATLMITIDCGTSNIHEIAYAKEHGIDVIVSDHHEPGSTLPAAVALINPKVGDTYPFDGLCGTGVVFKLVQALIARGTAAGVFTITPGWEKWWLDMVSVATIADMVPLRDENRTFVRYGLEVLRKSRRPGLQQLLRKQKASQRHLTEDDVGFTIGPRINAASRMDSPERAFLMLTTVDEGEAGAQVEHLEHLNNERKAAVAAMTRDLHGRLQTLDEVPRVLVMGNPQWRPSLVGLAANKLSEEYGRPVFLWGRDGNGVIKGSCRSDGVVSVVRLMDAIADRFIEYGGHHMSGGFAVHEEHIHTLPQALVDSHVTLGAAAQIEETTVIDAVLSLDDVTDRVLTTLARLAPFGTDNPKPVFAFKDVVPETVEQFGKTKEHIKLTFATRGMAREAIAFFATPARFARRPEPNQACTLLAHIEQSFFMGRLQTRLRIVDVI